MDTDSDDPAESIDVSDLYKESQTYRQMIYALLQDSDSPDTGNKSMDQTFLKAFESLKTV
jgi:hypothetical protein